MNYRSILPLVGLLVALFANTVRADYSFTRLAGTGYGSADGTGSAARFAMPAGMAFDTAGNLYIADTLNNTIRKITPAGVVTTLAGTPGVVGSSDGTGAAASFSYPQDIAVDSSGNLLVTDSENHTIRKITPAGVVTTLAGSPGSSGSADDTGTNARFNQPRGLTFDGAGNLYVTDSGNQTIRKITPAGVVTTLAGSPGITGDDDGTGANASFNYPSDIAVNSAGDLFVTTSMGTIRKVTASGVVTTWAGHASDFATVDGTGTNARFSNPDRLTIDGAGNLYVTDNVSHCIRKVTPAAVVTTIAGIVEVPGSIDGVGTSAAFNFPGGIAVDANGNLFVADTANGTIRKIGTDRAVTTFCGIPAIGSTDGWVSEAKFFAPRGVALDDVGNLHVAELGNHTIRKFFPGWSVSTLAGLAGSSGTAEGTGSDARFHSPYGVCVDANRNVYVADTNGNRIRKITSAGETTTYAGATSPGSADGTAANARFRAPRGVAIDLNGNIYVADTSNSTIRKITPEGTVSTIAGAPMQWGSTDGTGADARFFRPGGIAVDPAGYLYVSDQANYTIRKISPTGVVTTLAGSPGQTGYADGTGANARFSFPTGVAVDASGTVFVSDAGSNTVRMITPGGVVTTVGGLAGHFGNAEGVGSAARFGSPHGIACDNYGHLYIVDGANGSVFRGTAVPTITQQPASQSVIEGQPATLSVGVLYNPDLHYQWRKNGVEIPDANADTFTIAVTDILDGGVYDVVVSDYNGSIPSAAATLTITPYYPVVTNQGANRRVLNPGDSLNLTVTAAGTGTLHYQWLHNGLPIPGATTNTYSPGNVTFADSGWYAADVTDDHGPRRGSAFFVSVAPEITQLRGWGDNGNQQLTFPPGANDLTAISLGDYHAMGLRSDGTVITWGYNGQGQATVPDGLTNVAAISAGNSHSLALKSDGTVVAWGDFWDSKLAVPTDLDKVAAISAGNNHSLALRTNGIVIAWGNNFLGQSTVPVGLNHVVAISAGYTVSMALRDDGTVVTWGSWSGTPLTVPVGLTGVTAISAGSGHCLALKSDGTVVAWGRNDYGQSTVPMGLTGVVAISARGAHSLALKSDGSVVAWGYNSSGQTNVPSDLGFVVAVSGGSVNSLVLRDASDDTVPTITVNPAGQSLIEGQSLTLSVTATGVGPLSYQWRRNGTNVSGATASTFTREATPADAGTYDVEVSNLIGSVTSASAVVTVAPIPVITHQPTSRQIRSPGQSIDLSVTATGTSSLAYQWYRNGRPIAGATTSSYSDANGTYGDSGYYFVLITDSVGTRRSSAYFVTVAPTTSEIVGWGVNFDGPDYAPAGVTDTISISGGTGYAVALRRGGTVVPWGSNFGNVIGGVPVGLSDVVAISAGDEHVLALKSDGTVVSWGSGTDGKTTIPAGLNRVVSVAAGGTHSLALKSDGTVVAWGSNSSGQTTVPPGLSNVVAISAGNYHSMALKSDGTVVAWGYNLFGQSTVPVGLSDVVVIEAGYTHSLAAKSDGTVVAWGSNSLHEKDLPAGLKGVVALASVLALKSDGTVVGWSDSGNGQVVNVPANLTQAYAVAMGGYPLALRDGSNDTLPNFTLQPASQNVVAGQTATFTAAANGAVTTKYQWRKGGTNIPGATASTLTVTNVQSSSTGTYDVVATNYLGSSTSNPATLALRNAVSAASDFNNDGKPDLVLQNLTTGARSVRLMNGATVLSETALSGLSTPWSIVTGADFNADGQADLLLQNTQTGERKIRLMNGTTAGTDLSLGTVPVEWSFAAAADFNGDSKPDILLQNTNTGDRYIWFMNGSTYLGEASLGRVAVDWNIAAAADFNADNKPDILWQNTTTGLCYVWFMNGATNIGDASLGAVTPDWHIATAADFNGDNKPDLLWQNTTTGLCYVWFMNGTTTIGDANLGFLPAGWSLAGVPAAQRSLASTHDFNGDGKADILLQNTTTGDRYIWFMNGATYLGAASLGTVSLDWHMAATADFNGDNQPDILWQNTATGARYIWFMNGATCIGDASLGIVPPDWDFAAAADFNGDDKPDILLQNTITGDRYLWFMNGATYLGAASLGRVAPDWHIAAAADFNADGKADIVWQNTSTGDRSLWFMNGSSYLGDASLGRVALDWDFAAVADFNGDNQPDLLLQNTTTGDRSLWFMNGSTYLGDATLGRVPLDWHIAN